MEDNARTPLIWLDMEMTGLDPSRCVPLQVAIVLTDPELRELDAMELAIWQPEDALMQMEPFVRRMHTDNGLLERVRASETSVAQAERAMMQLVTRRCPFGTGVLAGNSIHTDRRFLQVYFPAFDRYLHYRMVDVSSLKELALRWYGRDALFTKHLQLHTALEDVRESIDELRHYREHLMKPCAKTT
jgi:oligoribonuclease